MLDNCPRCGSALECDTSPGAVWCVSLECGAVFRDIDLRGRQGAASPEEKGSGDDPAAERTARDATGA